MGISGLRTHISFYVHQTVQKKKLMPKGTIQSRTDFEPTDTVAHAHRLGGHF
jgi:hypothetical protein